MRDVDEVFSDYEEDVDEDLLEGDEDLLEEDYTFMEEEDGEEDSLEGDGALVGEELLKDKLLNFIEFSLLQK